MTMPVQLNSFLGPSYVIFSSAWESMAMLTVTMTAPLRCLQLLGIGTAQVTSYSSLTVMHCLTYDPSLMVDKHHTLLNAIYPHTLRE